MGVLTNCGPSTAVQNDAQQAQSFSNLLTSNYQQQFAQQSSILNALNASLSPIVAAGPNQQGFSAAELADLNTKAINATGAASRNAQQVAANAAAGQNNTSGLTSGVQKQIQGAIASQQAGNLANQQSNIQLQNYETGRQNYFNAVSGERALAGEYNPTGYASLTNQAEQQAFNQNHTVEEENNQMSADIIGGITSLAGGAATFGLGGIGNLDRTGGSSFGEQVGNFFSGGANALKG